MKYKLPYTFQFWKRSLPIHLKAIFYLVPMIVFLYSILLQAFLPVLSQYLFLKNSDYQYEIIFESRSDDAFQKTENPYIFSFAEMVIMEEDKVSDSLGEEIYFCKRDCDWQQSYFTDANLLSHIQNREDPVGLLLSYDCANILNAELGDNIKIGFGTYSIRGGDYFELPLIGIVKPAYDDKKLIKELGPNVSLAIVPDDVYEQLLNLEKECSPRTFCEQMNALPEKSTAVARTERLEHVGSALFGVYALYKWVFLAIIIIAILSSVLLMEINYIQRNYKQEMIILGKLGMKKKDAMSILGGLIFLDCIAAGIPAFVITKWYVLDVFLQTYVSAATYLLISLVLILILGAIIYLKCGIFNKKLYQEIIT